MKVIIKEDKLSLAADHQPDQREFQLKLDPAKQPKEIDLKALGGMYQGKTVPGIYEVKGDTLKLCLPNKDDILRPKEFNAPKDSRLVLLVLKRSK
jgi:uncharacterized protein (TIGR03067 family)